MSLIEKLKLPNDIKKLSDTELAILAKDIRQLILDTVILNGGHLASNLGVVELTLALYKVFDFPKDKLIFDVGHQCYTHKILSGRLDKFSSLRKKDGLSGFPKREESPYDSFNTGHSSSALSIACGFMRAKKLSSENFEIISVIGDGSLTGGLIFEALNDSGNIGEKQIIVLNDNSMSISKNVGAMSNYLLRLHNSSFYNSLKGSVSKTFSGMKFGKIDAVKVLENLKKRIKYAVQGGLPFDQFNLKYFGPIDGHNFKELINVLETAKKEKNSVIIHVVTKKGRGYLPAEINPDKYHGISASKCGDKKDCEEKTGEFENSNETFSEVFGKTLTEMAEKNRKIVAVTAAMSDGTGLTFFQNKFPERFFDVGIAEAHAVTMSAAMSLSGYKPYFAVYSSFLQRGFDELLLDVCMQNLPVTFCIDRAGIVGEDGETHQGIFDLSYLMMIPNLTVCAPKDAQELKDVLKFSENFNAPLAIRYPKGYSKCYKNKNKIEYSKWEKLTSDSNIYLLAVGAKMVEIAFKTSKLLKEKNILSTVVNCLFVKPFDFELLKSLNDKYVFTFEDNVVGGGFGANISLFLNSNNINCKVNNFAFPDKFISHASVSEIYEMNNLTSKNIALKIEKIIKK